MVRAGALGLLPHHQHNPEILDLLLGDRMHLCTTTLAVHTSPATVGLRPACEHYRRT